ncbi:hypothetical protein WS90_11955 [Burkholderia cepacia]|uniref:Transmembrane protein n=2 Tax=Burkholderia cepacia TaxID=292 RepID=A0A124SPC4_BURCE|nr:hypothetical protein WS90_11955 [Burkholderia cepacia]
MGWGVGLVAAAICLSVALFVLLIIGAFGDEKLTLVFSVPVLMVFVGLVLFIVGVAKAIRTRK